MEWVFSDLVPSIPNKFRKGKAIFLSKLCKIYSVYFPYCIVRVKCLEFHLDQFTMLSSETI